MTTEHPNVPALTVTNQRLAVIGGGEGHQFAEDGYNKVKVAQHFYLFSNHEGIYQATHSRT